MAPRTAAAKSLGGGGNDGKKGNNSGSGNGNGNGNNNNTRIALCLMATVVGMHGFGLAGSAWHLPSPVKDGGGRRRSPRWLRGLRGGGGAGERSSSSMAAAVPPAGGVSINLSKNGISGPGDDDEGSGEWAEEKEEEEEEEEEEEVEEGGGVMDEPENNGGDGDNGGPIPRARWPVSIRDEDGNFEDVVHPGHRAMGRPDVVMAVPRFWIDDPTSVHRNALMTRDRAMKIGSCVTPDEKTGNHARGDGCPVDDRTIYVAVASYRDWQCRDTVTSIFSRASFPGRVRVAVTDQIVEGEDGSCDVPHVPCQVDPSQALCAHKSRLDVFRVDAALSIGPVFARHMGHRMYRGEYYYMQADAHVTFTRGWDVDIVSQMESTGNEMAVLSTYLTDIEGSIDANGNSLRDTRPIMCNTDYEEGQGNRYLRHGSQPEAQPTIRGMPQLEPYWAAGFSFSRGHFVVNVPYDFYQPMIFQGEEMSIGIRGFTIGYDYYAPERSVCFHHYADGANKRKRNKVPHYWENGETYAGSGIKAMYRLLGIVHMNPEIGADMWDHAEESKYGLGGVRSPESFYDVFGIDVKDKVAEQHLCGFVETGRMHDEFMKFLRPDGMGIDYGKISFRFKGKNPAVE